MTTTPGREVALPQGDVRLLETDTAVELLARPIPARLAYLAGDGTPRIVPTWFHWTGDAIVMATWTAGPHVRHAARRVQDLRERPAVAISIDTDDLPAKLLQIRGRAAVEEVDGIVEEYALSAVRYLGAQAGGSYLASLEGLTVTMAKISVRPAWVGLIDFEERLPGPLGGVSS